MTMQYCVLLVLVLLCTLPTPIQSRKFIKDFILYDTTTGVSLGPLYDGRLLDVAVIGTNISVVADADATTYGKLVFIYDMRVVKLESNPIYAINGNMGPQLLPYTPLTALGTHLLTYQYYGPTNSTEVLQTRSVWFTVIDSINMGPFTPFTLVNTNTTTGSSGSEIQLPNSIPLSEVGTSLSILAHTINSTAVAKVSFWFDNKFIRNEMSAAWALNSNDATQIFPYRPLNHLGTHTIKVRAVGFDNENLGELTHTFTVTSQKAVSSPMPTPVLSPVFIPAPAMLHTPTVVVPPTTTAAAAAVEIAGELRKWHKVTLKFSGPFANETSTNMNPFMDYRLDVTFTHEESGKQYVIPGYFAADGNASETSATYGNQWHCHFAPDVIGIWKYSVAFVTGTNVSVTSHGTPTSFHGVAGDFVVASSNKRGRDHRGKGRLQYVGEHHLEFAEGGWFMRSGVDSPENFLAYGDFDNTPDIGGRRKSWSSHKVDFRAGDPTWKNGKGTGIIGAINYLSHEGINVFSFLTMNINGDDSNVFPFISDSPDDHLRMDVSKLAQWEIMFDHADKMGMFLHFKISEAECDYLLDNGLLGHERKLYYRELIARFGHHLALNWNLSEKISLTADKIKEFADYFQAIDPYHSLVVVNGPSDSLLYDEMTGYQSIQGAALQTSTENVHSYTLRWLLQSAASGKKWIVWNNQQNPTIDGLLPDIIDSDHDSIRQLALWGSIMAGGSGIEYYFGHGNENSDLTAEDFRTRANMWKQSRYALEFFDKNLVEFWNMHSDYNRLPRGSTDWVLKSKDGDQIVIYRYNNAGLGVYLHDLPGRFLVYWYNPREGGPLQDGTVTTIIGGISDLMSYGLPPEANEKDWVVLLKRVSS